MKHIKEIQKLADLHELLQDIEVKEKGLTEHLASLRDLKTRKLEEMYEIDIKLNKLNKEE